VTNPLEKIHFLYIIFPPFVKAVTIADFGLRISEFIHVFSFNPQSAIANPQSINSLADPSFFC